MMTSEERIRVRLRLTAPRAMAAAGILFALLFAASVILMRLALPETLSSDTSWVEQGARWITLSLLLMPFAGITFLWFMGVIRDRLSEVEEHFLSTVFLGSGLLFLAMAFVAMAIAGGIVNSVSIQGGQNIQPDLIVFGRAVMLQISNVYALRMAGAFMISLGTIWLRTNLMPRWLVIVTYSVALILLVVINLSLWTALIFPVWVFLVSVFILLTNLRGPVQA